MLRLTIRFITVAALVGALASAVWWWLHPDQDWLQAPSTALALVAAVSGIPADRWAADAQRRQRALLSLRQELRQNRDILADRRFRPEHQGIGQVYPRLMLGAVDTAFISGGFDASRDKALVEQLLAWRNVAKDLNRRLDMTELRLLTVERLSGDELSALRAILDRPDGYFVLAAGQLDELEAALVEATRPLTWRWWRRARNLVKRSA